MTGKCEYPPSCTNDPCITYVGKALCYRHWNQLASADPAMEKVILANLGLERVDGFVVKAKKAGAS